MKKKETKSVQRTSRKVFQTYQKVFQTILKKRFHSDETFVSYLDFLRVYV